MANKAGNKKPNATNASVALQQRSGGAVTKYAKLTPSQLHQQTLNARETFFKMCVGAEAYAVDVLLPYCVEIIARFRMPGVAAKNRPNGRPTVEAYFRSININYSTVRTWILRKRLSTEMFDPEKSASTNKDGPPHMTQLEARLLGTASAGHDLVDAIIQSGKVDDAIDEAIKDFVGSAPTRQRIDEYIVRPVRVAGVTEVEKLAIRLCKLIARNDGKQGQKILALAREILTKAEPVEQKKRSPLPMRLAA